MRCTFCATGKGGFARNLKAHEIVDQVMTVQEEFRTRVSNIGGANCDMLHNSCKMQISIVCSADVMHDAACSHSIEKHPRCRRLEEPHGKQSLCSAVQMCLPYCDQ
jgi:hypothetical protein